MLGCGREAAGVKRHLLGREVDQVLPNGLNIPAHSTVRLAPGGYHIMFTRLKKPLEKGETISATMTFEKAGPIVVQFPVEGIGAMGDHKM